MIGAPVRIFLVLSALVWAPYGAFCLLSPGSLADNAGLLGTSATGLTEIRAMYGGLQLGIGVLAGLALLRRDLQGHALLALAFLTAGLFLGRLVGVVVDGDVSGYTATALVFELTSSVVAALLFVRSGPVPAPA